MATPNDCAALARTHLITAAESLRVASARLCDYVEATMGESEPLASESPAATSPSPAPASAPRRCRFIEADGTPSELYEWGANSPAPASAPLSETAPISCAGNTGEIGKARRWWLVVNGNGGAAAFPEAELGMAQFCARRWDEIYPQRAPHSVVPVIEARVTRETVDRVEGIVRTARGTNRTSEHWAYEIVRALGLTVEGDDNG